ncbi:hypothetical protein CL629_02065 [bacterium]|nr:hypothetical protein [bacterium]
MAQPFQRPLIEKNIDISYGDLVYLRGDDELRAGIGVVVSLERESFDIHDAATCRKGFFLIEDVDSSVSLSNILVYWFKIEKEMWMEGNDLSVATA